MGKIKIKMCSRQRQKIPLQLTPFDPCIFSGAGWADRTFWMTVDNCRSWTCFFCRWRSTTRRSCAACRRRCRHFRKCREWSVGGDLVASEIRTREDICHISQFYAAFSHLSLILMRLGHALTYLGQVLSQFGSILLYLDRAFCQVLLRFDRALWQVLMILDLA